MIATDSSLALRPAQVARGLGLVVALLTALSAVVQFALYGPTPSSIPGLVKLDAGWEASIPTYYSALLLLLAAALLGVIGRHVLQTRAPYARHWLALAVIFLLMSMDEVVSLHEGLSDPVRGALGLGGALYYAWIVPALVFVAALGLAYGRFLFHLPPSVRRWFIAAAVTYVGGAAGMEGIGGLLAGTAGEQTLAYGLAATFEEGLEMLGVVVFIYALLCYAGRTVHHLTLTFGGEDVP